MARGDVYVVIQPRSLENTEMAVLLREFNRAGFADDVDFDRTRILHGTFNLDGDITG
jgi:hypothetical protein